MVNKGVFVLGSQNFHEYELRSIQRTTWCNAYTSVCKLLLCEFIIEVNSLLYTNIQLSLLTVLYFVLNRYFQYVHLQRQQDLLVTWQ
jgi:hypothetical protein